ncbi:hypothetical protein LEP1GSC051_4299 [Leptospira sp. P2653]|nr:hypothetical protein LEP1GSC051_4299 [Leptospira sp. P2653]
MRNSIEKIRKTEYKDFIGKSRNIINGERLFGRRCAFPSTEILDLFGLRICFKETSS